MSWVRIPLAALMPIRKGGPFYWDVIGAFITKTNGHFLYLE
jgi:hypothetical protein